jgi:uncharacterized repeat protein (TIGR03803 family)
VDAANTGGSLFALTPPASSGGVWTEAVLFNGVIPNPGMMFGSNGVLYGTTNGGTFNDGTVFSLSPPSSPGGTWKQNLLYTIRGFSDGSDPTGTLVIGNNGVLYGTTAFGGSGVGQSGFGVLFSLTPPTSPGGEWAQTVIYSFAGPSDGISPTGLMLGSGGSLYGFTTGGGATGNGTVFSLTPSNAPGSMWTKTVLYSFAGGIEGQGPFTGAIGSGGDLRIDRPGWCRRTRHDIPSEST